MSIDLNTLNDMFNSLHTKYDYYFNNAYILDKLQKRDLTLANNNLTRVSQFLSAANPTPAALKIANTNLITVANYFANFPKIPGAALLIGGFVAAASWWSNIKSTPRNWS